MAEHITELVNLRKDYGNTTALDGINLYIRKNEFLTLLGPSGCGKSTTLRLIAGFEQATGGEVLFRGKALHQMLPYQRPCNNGFQRDALLTHMNVFENVAFGLRIKKVSQEEIKKRVNDALHLVNLDGYGQRRAESLSGGQMQRVAIARAVVNRPEVLLLDEPLGALDLKMRQDMQLELKNMQRHLGITFIYVTHDQEEALAMSDTVVVMKDGVIQQIGTPEDVYNEPKNPFVADFIGESNIIPGIMLKDLLVNFAGYDFPCVDKGFGENTPVDVVVRPEDISIVPPEGAMMRGVVQSTVFYGYFYEMTVESNGFTWLLQNTRCVQPGETIGMNLFPNDIHIMAKGE